MSRLWDTLEYWARSEADEMLCETTDTDPAALADSFERSATSYHGEPEMVAAIIADLRRRADAGVRFWPGPQPVGDEQANDIASAQADASLTDLSDDEIPW
jgi:hypothetical protein